MVLDRRQMTAFQFRISNFELRICEGIGRGVRRQTPADSWQRAGSLSVISYSLFGKFDSVR